MIPQVLSIYEDRLPDSRSLYRVLPKGLVQLVLMLLVGAAVGALLLSVMNEKADDFLATTFVLLLVPGFVLSIVSLFGRDGEEPRIGWGKRFAGVGLLVLGVLLALGLAALTAVAGRARALTARPRDPGAARAPRRGTRGAGRARRGRGSA